MSDPTSLGSADVPPARAERLEASSGSATEALEARVIAGTTTREDVRRLVESLEALTAERDELRAALMRVGEALSDLEKAGSDPAVLNVVRTAVRGR